MGDGLLNAIDLKWVSGLNQIQPELSQPNKGSALKIRGPFSKILF